MRPLFGWNKISKVEVGLELLSMTMFKRSGLQANQICQKFVEIGLEPRSSSTQPTAMKLIFFASL